MGFLNLKFSKSANKPTGALKGIKINRSKLKNSRKLMKKQEKAKDRIYLKVQKLKEKEFLKRKKDEFSKMEKLKF